MKTSSPRMRLGLAAAVVGLAVLPLAASARENELEINVRPEVVDKEAMWAGKTPARDVGGHSKIYGILTVQEVKSELKLVRKVDENAILQLLSEELNKNGFQLYAPGQKPEIVLTVSYGRGMLQNPYLPGSAGISGATNAPFGGPGTTAGPRTSEGVKTSTYEGAFITQFIDQKSPGFEARLQKAATEKLYIRVVAWDYPSGPKAKTKMLWKTTMVVDDPDHRDLNAIAGKMIEAGVPYFDREIREREADVYKPLPDGKVKVGTPEIVPPTAK